MASDQDDPNDAAQIVKPPRDLRSKVRVLSEREAAKFDPVKAAEAALNRLSGDFDNWMENEAAALGEAWTEILKDGVDQERRDALFRAAHDIKGQASTLGYPTVGAVAGNLCYLIEHVAAENWPNKLIAQHVDAVRAMVAETGQQENNATARALVDRLVDVTEDYIARYGIVPDA